MTKKLTSLLLVLCVVVSMIPAFTIDITAKAAASDPSTEWEYTPNGDGTITLTKYLGTDTDVFIPASITADDGTKYTVTKLGDSVFENNDAINSATFAEGITEIGANAFYDADNLVCIVTNNTLTTIGDNAFTSCDVFNSAILYDTVTTIAETAFSDCANVTLWVNEGSAAYTHATTYGIKYVVIGSYPEPEIYTEDNVVYSIYDGEVTVTGYGSAISGALEIPAHIKGVPVVKIYDNAFSGCTGITSLALPNTVRLIGIKAFYQCTALTSVAIPASVISVDESAFQNCTALNSLVLSEGIELIGKYAFKNNSIKTLVLPASLKTVGKYAFERSKSLQTLTIKKRSTYLENYAFYESAWLTDIYVDNGLSCSYNAFYSCYRLRNIHITDFEKWYPGNQLVTSAGGYPSYNLYMNGKPLTEITIPESVTVVGTHAFYGNDNVEKVILHDNVTEVGYEAFWLCNNLKEVVIGKGLETVKQAAFGGTPLNTVYIDSFEHLAQIKYERESDNPLRSAENLFIDGVQVTELVVPEDVTQLGGAYAGPWMKSAVIHNKVTRLNTQAFSQCTNLEKVTLPNNLTYIGDSAFYGCTKLKEITIPDKVTTIGKQAFSNCEKIEKIVIPDSVTSIGESSFANMYNLKEVVLSSRLRTIPKGAFSIFYNKTSALGSVVIPESVTSIGESAFAYQKNLSEITLPESIISIGKEAFYSCESLASVKIPSMVKRIEESTFEGCYLLADVKFPEELTYVGNEAFSHTRIADVSLPEGVLTIGDSAFFYCQHLATVDLPLSLTSIGTQAFYVTKVKEATLSYNISSIGTNAFPTGVKWYVYSNSYAQSYAESNSIEHEILSGFEMDLITYEIADGEAYVKSCNVAATGVIEIASEINGIPVTAIGENAFANCVNITEIVIPEGVKTIKRRAFADCYALVNITLPSTVTTLEDNAFIACKALKEIIIPEGVTTVTGGLFYDCYGIETIVLPSTVTSISGWAFWNCRGLKNINLSESITSIGEYAFANCWVLESLELPSQITVLNTGVFATCRALKEIAVPSGVTSIKENAFYGCSSLENIVLPDDLTTIGASAFGFCGALDNITIPTGVKIIEAETFYNCTGLKSVVLHNDIAQIKSEAFYNCSSLAEITIPEKVSFFGESAFENCTSLEKATVLAKNITSIPNYAFKNCTSLSDITLSDNITTISMQAFYGCVSLKTPFIGSGLIQFGTSSFENCGFENLIFPNTIRSISPSSFYNCDKLVYVDLSDSSIGLPTEVFADCNGLKKVVFSEDIVSINETAFDKAANVVLYVPKNSYAHTFAKGINIKYIIMEITGNPEVYYGTYIVTAETSNGTAAKEMCDTINVTVYNAEGTQISEVFTNTPRDYAMYLIESSDDEKAKVVAVDMLNYGAAAQEQFGYNTEYLANSHLTDEQKALATGDVEAESNRVAGENFAGASLQLKSNILLISYFNKPEDMSGMYATVEFENHRGIKVAETVPSSDFATNYAAYIGVKTTSLVVSDAKQTVTVNVYNADGSLYGTVTDTVESYVANATSAESAITNALAKFAASAYNYFHN